MSSDAILPALSESEQAAMDSILDAMHRIQNLNGRKLTSNVAELVHAVHVLQGFVIQAACGRLGLFGCNDRWREHATPSKPISSDGLGRSEQS